MAGQTPVQTPPPPTIPKLNDQTLTSYLRGLSLWAQTNLSGKIPTGQALPGILLQAYDTETPKVFLIRVNAAGTITATAQPLGQGKS